MRLGELLELQWGDINWRGSYVEVRHAFVGGVVTTPKNHQRRRVELSRQLRAELLLWRRRERAAWLKRGRPAPPWLFASVSGTRLDPSNVRKAFDRVLSAARMHQRGPHQMRHTCASLLLQHGAAITYVARQLGHRDASTTLRIYAHWLPDASRTRAVDLLDGTRPAATPAQPAAAEAEWKTAVSACGSVVSRTLASWNQIAGWLRQIDGFRVVV